MRNLESLPNMEKVRRRSRSPRITSARPACALWQPRLAIRNDMPFVHIAGSKGKGSVVEMLAASLTGCGYGVGVHLAPPVDVREHPYR